jgi:hypothetical protein
MNLDLNLFLQAWTGGVDLPPEECERLLRRFETDPLFRTDCIAEMQMLGMTKAVQSNSPRWLEIQDVLGLNNLEAPQRRSADMASGVLRQINLEAREVSKARQRYGWWQLAAALAGLVIGLLSASVVYGLGNRSIGRLVPLLHESFETGPSPLAKGVPPDASTWSGDYSEVVGPQQGLRPGDGRKMVRLLRSDHEGRDIPRPSRQGDLMRIIDLRPFLNAAAGTEAVVTLSALFNAIASPPEEHYDGMVTVYALAADIHLEAATEDTIKRDALAFSLGRFGGMDRDPASWQQASAQLLLPRGTAFVMLKVSVMRIPSEKDKANELPDTVGFSGHFVDDVRASIRFREAVPGPRIRSET